MTSPATGHPRWFQHGPETGVPRLSGLVTIRTHRFRRATRPRNSCYALLTPSVFRIVIIGHQFVNADWNRLSPTKAVNQNQ